MNKYKRFSQYTLEGFIVNTFDNLNYDIHLKTSCDNDRNIIQRYDNVIKESFSYIDINMDELEETVDFDDSKGLIIKDETKIKKSNCYRCRLKNISCFSVGEIPDENKICQEVTDIINERNGWVKVNVSDVDIYNRILVDIFDITGSNSISNVLIKNYPERYHEYIER